MDFPPQEPDRDAVSGFDHKHIRKPTTGPITVLAQAMVLQASLGRSVA
jgi:hypothetical protein